MEWLRRLRGSPRPIESRIEPQLRFVGQFDGPLELDLRMLWTPVLATTRAVRSAYLAMISTDGGTTSLPVLCVCQTLEAEQLPLVEELGALFQKRFQQGLWFDFVFPDARQEVELKAVCRPFYEREPQS